MILVDDNNVVLCGVIVKEPLKKVVKNEWQIIELCVVVGEKEGKKIFRTVYSWGTKLLPYKKGDAIFVAGFLENDDYTSKDGSLHKSFKVRVEYVTLANDKNTTSNKLDNQVEIENVNTMTIDKVDDDGLPF